MYAIIRSYPDPACSRDDVVRAGRHYASVLDALPGFLSCLILRSENGQLSVLTLFDEKANVPAAEHLSGPALADYLDGLPGPADCVTSEVVFQRGL